LGKFYALPQSPQLFKQILIISGIDKYFQIAKCFRDEDLRADRQPEFTQLDIEMAFINEEEIFCLVEGLMSEIFKGVLGINLEVPFPRLSYKKSKERHGTDKPDTRQKGDKFNFLWITDFPLFNYNAEQKRWESEHHPFTAPQEEDIPLFDRDPGSMRSRAYDLVVNGIEVGSGSIRIHKREVQEKLFQVIGIQESEYRERFGFLIEALSYGAPPHGGFALGLDRFVAILAGTENIREVIAFPKTQKAICPLTGAPSSVSKDQLKELGLKARHLE
jgi:aspartyl-tRNA synthetase